MTTFDAEWTDDDISAAMAWMADDADRCPGCGHHRDESMDIDHAGNFYDAEPVTCHACAARDRAQKAHRDQNGDQAGVYWRITERG